MNENSKGVVQRNKNETEVEPYHDMLRQLASETRSERMERRDKGEMEERRGERKAAQKSLASQAKRMISHTQNKHNMTYER